MTHLHAPKAVLSLILATTVGLLAAVGGTASATAPTPTALTPATSTSSAIAADDATSVVLGTDAETGMSIRQVRNAAGAMTYYVYRPAGLADGAPMVVHLHGANMDARQAAHKSGLNALADRRGFIVVYPQEDPNNGRLGIWNWSSAAEDQTADRAVSLVADLTRIAGAEEGADPTRTFISGISAGGGMAVVMAAIYPDLYRAIHVEVGCMFGCLTGLLGEPTMVSTLDPETAGRNAYAAMGERARRIPMLVSYGTLDPNAALADQEALIQQWLVTNDLVDDHQLNGSVSRTVAARRTGFDERSFTVDEYVDAAGCVLVERYLIDGMRHAYSGGTPTSALDTDVDAGPDMRAVAYDFFLAQAGVGESC